MEMSLANVLGFLAAFLFLVLVVVGIYLNRLTLKDIREAKTEERKAYLQKGRKQLITLFKKVLLADILLAVAAITLH